MNEDKSVGLVEGLIAEIYHSVPTQEGADSWRVVIKFYDTTGEDPLLVSFGSNNEFTEYFVWVTDIYLDDHTKFPPSREGAEKFALDYIANRFEETKDKNGDRSVSFIEENSLVCFHGRCERGINLSLPIVKTKNSF